MKLRSLVFALSLSLFATLGTAQANIIKAILLPPVLIGNAISSHWEEPVLGHRAVALAIGTTSLAWYSVPPLNVTATSANLVYLELSGIAKVRIAEKLVSEIEDYQFTGEASQILSETLALNEVSEENEAAFLNNLNLELNKFLKTN